MARRGGENWRGVTLLAAVLLAWLSGGVAGQSSNDDASVREQLRQLETEIEQEQRSLEESQQQWEQREQALRERRSELADAVLRAHEEAEQLGQGRDELHERRDQLAGEVEALREQDEQVRSGASAVAEQMLVMLDELPGEQQTRQELREAIDQLDDSDDEAVDAALATIVRIVNQTHERGTTLTLREAEVWNVAGEREQVKLLTAGHVGFAYQSTDGERMAVALGSPSEAAGYRWVEPASGEVARLLGEAFAAAERGEAVTLPLDVSGELRVEAVTEQQTWADVLGSGGIVMIPLAFVAIVAVLLVLERAWVLYGRNGSAEKVARRMLDACRRGEFEQAEQLARRGRGAVARTLAACLRRRGEGTHAIEDSIQEQLLHELPRLQRFLGGIAILAAVAPLLGLLGTVTGIIETFGVIRAFGNGDPGLMAGGISEALITTAAGLSIAIPILLLHALLRGRVDRIIADCERHAATLLNTLGEARPTTAEGEAADRHSRREQEVGA